MTQEDVLRMARETGDVEVDRRGRETFSYDSHGLERFAALVAKAERQRCAQIARQFDGDHPLTNYGGCIARIIEESDASQP